MKLGRNAPCPCGSGRKFKHCCAGTDAEAAAVPRAHGRACGSCTACCDGWVKINVYGHEVYPGKPCPYSTGHSCSIYERRPVNPCQRFICGWLADGSPLPESFRPDRLGVLIELSRWRGGLFYLLVPAGRDPDDALVAWMQDLGRRTGTPFLYQREGSWFGHGPEAFLREMAERRERGGAMVV